MKIVVVRPPSPLSLMLLALQVPDPRPRRVEVVAKHARPVVMVRSESVRYQGRHSAVTVRTSQAVRVR